MPLDPHMSGDEITWYLQNWVSEAKQTFVSVGNLPKKLHKIEPLSSQKIRPKNEQPKVKGFWCFIVLSGPGKC